MDKQTAVHIVDTPKYGRVVLVELAQYAMGETLQELSERYHTRLVLLIKDDEAATMTVAEIEAAIAAILGE